MNVRRAHRLLGATLLAGVLGLVRVEAQPAPAPGPAVEETVGRDTREMDVLLGRLTDGTPAARRAAADEIVRSLEVDDIPAIRQRLLVPARFDVEQLRLKIIRAVRTVTANRPNADYDLLQLLLEAPRSADLDWAIERVVLARALGPMPSANAGRAILDFAAAHNAIFRQEVGRIVRGQMRDYVVPALIEFRRPSELMRIFLGQLREELRRVTPGQTVQLRDNALLAEVLRAYGAVRLPDAMQVVVSFVNSERTQVREAARAATAQYGRNAIHALRASYEIYEGRAPDAAWGWERVATELYAAYDRRRADEVLSRFQQGLTAAREGRPDDMLGHFRWVLARHPDFPRRAEMVAPLVAHAQGLQARDGRLAEPVWRLALWVDPEGANARRARAAILFLDAERALARGVAEPELYRAVLRVDPSHALARTQLDRVVQSAVLRARFQRRLLAAAAILALALGGLWALLRTRTARNDRGDPKPPRGPQEGPSTPPTQPRQASVQDTEPEGTTTRLEALVTGPG